MRNRRHRRVGRGRSPRPGDLDLAPDRAACSMRSR